MSGQGDFRDELLSRIHAYRRAEARLEARHAEIGKELETMRERREASEKLFEAEFGEAAEDDSSVLAGWSKLPMPRRRRNQTSAQTSEELPAGPLSGLGWEEAIARILRDHGPMHVSEIWSELSKGGFHTESSDPLRSITAIASRSRRLVKTAPRTYGLVGQAVGRGQE